MRKLILSSVLMSLALVLSAANLQGQGFPVSFQADYVDICEYEEATGKYYAGPEGMRMEGMMDGERQIMIVNFSRSVSWIILEDERMYYELPLGPDAAEDFTSVCAELSVKETMVGRETMQGRSVEKWHCEKFDGRVDKIWFDSRLKVPLRTEENGNIFELRNIREGRVSGDLFQPPAGYQKLSMPGLQFNGGNMPDFQEDGGFFGGGFPGMGQDEYMSDKDENGGMLEGLRGIFGR